MKKSFFIAITLMAAAIAVAVVSCKKETPNAMLSNQPQATKMFYPEGVDDMNAYLKDFKQKMQTVTRGDDEMLSLEEAAWHLSSVANYDFANVNVEFTDLRYDTLYYQVRVTNGQVSLSDLNAVYANMANDIDAFYHSLDLQEKHFRFIGASVSADGQVMATMITSYYILDHAWYFNGVWNAYLACYEWFDENIQYVWNTTAIERLEEAINFYEGRAYANPPVPPVHARGYYLYTMTVEFNYADHTDQYHSPFVDDSRIYAWETDSQATPTLDLNLMCYCLDSYLDLPFSTICQQTGFMDQRPVHWDITSDIAPPTSGTHWHTFHHILNVKFARYIISDSSNEY